MKPFLSADYLVLYILDIFEVFIDQHPDSIMLVTYITKAHLNVYALATGAASPGYTLVPRAGSPGYTFVPRAGSPEYTPVIGLVALIT